MSRFYGTLKGQAKTTATRRGNADSTLVTICASWKGAIRCTAYAKGDDDYVCIERIRWPQQERVGVLYDGPMDALDE
jgi:hypothetical protein